MSLNLKKTPPYDDSAWKSSYSDVSNEELLAQYDEAQKAAWIEAQHYDVGGGTPIQEKPKALREEIIARMDWCPHV